MTSGFFLKPLLEPDFGIKRLKLHRTIALSPTKGSRTRLAYDESSGVYYALKISRKRDICAHRRFEQIRNSLYVMSRLQCTFAQNMLAFFQDEADIYYLLDFIPGGGRVLLIFFQTTQDIVSLSLI